jgi:hypothetical protein
MRNGVITLIPKKGDLTALSNWRPITLLNTDYKLIMHCLSSRISSMLPSLTTTDQSYCVRGTTIYTNVHLIRDVIEHANQKDVPLAVISLDQASAYDSVEHPYIYHVLSKYGFGPNFIRHVKTVYRNAQGLVKVQDTLTASFLYERGVRQGDPLSGSLFVLTIEPFLKMCNIALQERGLPVPLSNNTTLVTNAYADDVTVLLTKDEGIKHLLHTFMIYGAVSGATLNVQKSTGLFAG